MSSVSPTQQDLSNDTTFSQIKSRVPVPISQKFKISCIFYIYNNSYLTVAVHIRKITYAAAVIRKRARFLLVSEKYQICLLKFEDLNLYPGIARSGLHQCGLCSVSEVLNKGLVLV